jgi:hypothetical protein
MLQASGRWVKARFQMDAGEESEAPTGTPGSASDLTDSTVLALWVSWDAWPRPGSSRASTTPGLGWEGSNPGAVGTVGLWQFASAKQCEANLSDLSNLS